MQHKTAEIDLKQLIASLETDGIVTMPPLLTADQLSGMQRAFESRLAHFRLSDVDGYEKTERYRHMVQDVLILDQGFVDLALHPLVTGVIREYVGRDYALCEAKGWLSLPNTKDFHGWHGDAWYDQTLTDEIPREVKLAIYLTDVQTGAFHYLRGSHRKQHPRNVPQKELTDVPQEDVLEMTGPAGTVILFDTSGIHRQGMPILAPRQAAFLAYHDPAVPLQQEDIDYYRYHPLILNGTFLGDMSEEQRRILGFGNKINYRPAFMRKSKFPFLQRAIRGMYDSRIYLDAVSQRWMPRIKRLVGR